MVHEKQEYLKFSPKSPYISGGEKKEWWETFKGEKEFELEVEEFLASLCPNPLCKSQIFKDLQGLKKEDTQFNNTDEEENQGSSDYIGEWFQTIIRLGHHFNLQHLLASKQLDEPTSHI